MNKIFYAITIILLCNLTFSQTTSSEEQFHKDMIAKDNKSEVAYYNYAFFLFSKDRFNEARAQLKALVALNPNNKNAIKLQNEMNRIDSSPKSDSRKMEILNFITNDIQDSTKEAKIALDPKNIQKEIKKENNSRREILLKKYDALVALNFEEPFDMQEFKQSNLANKYLTNGEKDKAELIFQENIVKFPNFSNSYYSLANLYLNNNKFRESAEVVEKGIAKFPKNVELLLIKDALKIVNESQSTEAKNKALDELKMLQLEWTQMKLEKLTKK